MPDHSIDDLIAAVETIQVLKDTLTKHERALSLLADKLQGIESRLVAIESGKGRKPR